MIVQGSFIILKVMNNFDQNLLKQASDYFTSLLKRPVNEEEVELFLKSLLNFHDLLSKE
jgi:hypothetical protein